MADEDVMKDTGTTNKTTGEIDKVTDSKKKEGLLTPERVKDAKGKKEFEPPKPK